MGYATSPFNGDSCLSKSLPTLKRWTLPRQWKQPIPTLKVFKATEPLIHKFSRQASKPKLAKLCYGCGRGSHSPTECRFRESTCHHCNKKGHIAPVCRSKTKEKKRTSKPTGRHKQGQHRANYVHEDVQP